MLKHPNYVYGPRNFQIPLSVNFSECALERLTLFGDRAALINAATEEQITYSQLHQSSIDVAISLSELGVKKGDIIAICSENRLEYFPSVIGTMCTGAVISPISVSCTTDEMKHIMSICKAKYVFCSPMMYQLHAKTWKTMSHIKRLIIFGDRQDDAIWFGDLINKNIDPKKFIPVDVNGQKDILAILYSSGTTGLPKGVMITHLNGISACSPDLAASKLTEIRNLTVSPWFHAMGFWGSIAGLIKGRTLVYLPKYSELAYLEAVHKYKPNLLTAPPPIVVMLSKTQNLSKYDVTSVQYMYSGAAPLDLETITDIKRRFPNLIELTQGYGMTETTLAISRDTEDSPKGANPKSVGIVAPGCIVKIIDTKTGEVCKPYEKGEICIKGPNIMKGYLGKNNSEYFDADGFFKTGDVGYFDEDEYLFVVDRLKELIKYKGYQVAPAELEAVLLQHPAVRDAAVSGKPDRASGELPMAFVVKQPGVDVDEKDIVEFVASKVSKEKKLRGGVVFVNEIPKNPSGKILRNKLKHAVRAGKSKL